MLCKKRVAATNSMAIAETAHLAAADLERSATSWRQAQELEHTRLQCLDLQTVCAPATAVDRVHRPPCIAVRIGFGAPTCLHLHAAKLMPSARRRCLADVSATRPVAFFEHYLLRKLRLFQEGSGCKSFNGMDLATVAPLAHPASACVRSTSLPRRSTQPMVMPEPEEKILDAVWANETAAVNPADPFGTTAVW
jgi:hypothetical protein